MMPTTFLRFRLWTLVLLASLFMAACSDSGTGPEDELAPLVGTWRARAMVLTNQASPDSSVDLVQEGATFTLSILATGEYSAALSFLGSTHTELGTVEVSGSQITITPTTPPGPPTSGTWSLTDGIVYIDGTTEFDFNLDGTDEPADIHIELYAVDL